MKNEFGNILPNDVVEYEGEIHFFEDAKQYYGNLLNSSNTKVVSDEKREDFLREQRSMDKQNAEQEHSANYHELQD